jgi:hypothetical protein
VWSLTWDPDFNTDGAAERLGFGPRGEVVRVGLRKEDVNWHPPPGPVTQPL